MPQTLVAAGSPDRALDSDAPPRPVGRLHRAIVRLLEAYPFTEYIGPDPRIENLIECFGLHLAEAAVVRSLICQRRVTVIGVPTAVWSSPGHRAALIAVKRVAAWIGIKVLLAPEAAIRRHPRLETARVIAEAGGVPVSAEDRSAIIRHLLAEGHSTLHRCASEIRSSAGYSAVLAMAALGIVHIDLDRRLSPGMPVELPNRRNK